MLEKVVPLRPKTLRNRIPALIVHFVTTAGKQKLSIIELNLMYCNFSSSAGQSTYRREMRLGLKHSALEIAENIRAEAAAAILSPR